MLRDHISQLMAAQSFSLSEKFSFVGIEDITQDVLPQAEESDKESIEIWATIEVPFTGTLPESYKVLNLTIGDWVTKNEPALTKVIHKELKDYLTASYPDSEIEISDTDDTAIWLDQLDYMPRHDTDKNTLKIEIELVLEAEPLEDK